MKSLLLKVFTIAVTMLLNVQSVKSEYKIPAVGPLPEMDCKQIWYQSTYSYKGCGAGNGNVCSSEADCPDKVLG